MIPILKAIVQTPLFWVYLIIVNLIALFAMALDKWKAGKGAWRIKEKTLFTLAITGGIGGALLSMRLFRHKTRKPAFRIGFPIIGIAWITVLAWLLIFA